MKKAILFNKLQNREVQCTACSWYCKISQEKTGICGVRKNIKGELFLMVYGDPVAVHIDPIEKKPLFHFLPGSKILSIGTIGCNFACDFCQNWDISQFSHHCEQSEVISCKNHQLSPKEIIKYCLDHQIPSIAFTYNEPAIFFEYAYDTIKLAKSKNIKTVYVSNGFESHEQIAMLKGNLDAVNIDLKAFSEKFYEKICHGKLQPVLDNIKRFYNAGIWTEITTLIIPGENDSDRELKKIAGFIAGISKDIPWHVTRFYPYYKMLNKKITEEDTLKKAYEIGKSMGLKFIYTGNVQNNSKENTYCFKCNSLLIKRNFDKVKLYNFDTGKCTLCRSKIEGIWKR